MNRMKQYGVATIGAAALILSISGTGIAGGKHGHKHEKGVKNVIFFVGDGMGVSTVTATRIFSVGVDGSLTMDRFPNLALSKTYSADHITPDSAGTMTAMMTGVNANSGSIGYGPETEVNDFNGDGDGFAPWSALELAKQAGKKVGVVTTARVTHATPAACYAHINHRDKENEIALQTLPTDPTFNERLGDGLDVLMGGGRRFFVPSGVTDEEGSGGSRPDGRDLRDEFQAAGYTYVWNTAGFDALSRKDLPVLGLFESSHMEYEYDRASDLGGEPSLEDMTAEAIRLLDNRHGFFLMVEAGRIDHAHHASNAYRSLTDTEELDQAVRRALKMTDLRDTLVIVTADHSHVFNIAGYPLREYDDIAYDFGAEPPEGYQDMAHHGILDVVYDMNAATGEVAESEDSNGVPYTALVYGNGPGFRGTRGTAMSLDPRMDTTPGLNGDPVSGPDDPDYLQESAVSLSSETHSGEEVAIYAAGPQSWLFNGTVKNTKIFDVMVRAMGL